MLRILLKFNDKVLKVVDTDKEQLTIGRNLENDLQIDNLAVSSFHARVENQLGHYFIEDLNSTNGTFVNGRKITRWGLKPDDAVTIGKHTLVFMMEEGDSVSSGAALRELDMDKTMVLETRQHREALDRLELSGYPLGVLNDVGSAGNEGEFELTRSLTVMGKDPGADIQLRGWFAPKVAGYVLRGKDGYTLSPGEGRLRLKVNGRSVTEDIPLKEGDLVEVASRRLRFHLRQ
ncbi:FHA domain-containing protein [Desulfuromonas sp. AOP6]|uniref:FHA domain-containing protein n=1 Tax=Desulfuromonas sp. AOP6 TaxID=1566351 RepID=UPI001285CB0B|nr:FHA domain-containing protein [Desulfuromonas sp. AOP6]BCA80349.1 hypothetical protein AOP6_2136 [Desulfuromonas sp. AOP6]